MESRVNAHRVNSSLYKQRMLQQYLQTNADQDDSSQQFNFRA